jgi:hypothetical protein
LQIIKYLQFENTLPNKNSSDCNRFWKPRKASVILSATFSGINPSEQSVVAEVNVLLKGKIVFPAVYSQRTHYGIKLYKLHDRAG